VVSFYASISHLEGCVLYLAAILLLGVFLCVAWLKDHLALIGVLSEGDTEFEKFDDDVREVFEEEFLVFGVLLDVLLESLVRDKSHVGRKHHQCFSGLVLELLGY
jgi:hypothetical protein